MQRLGGLAGERGVSRGLMSQDTADCAEGLDVLGRVVRWRDDQDDQFDGLPVIRLEVDRVGGISDGGDDLVQGGAPPVGDGEAFPDPRCSLQFTFPDGIRDVLGILDQSMFMEQVDQFIDRAARITRFKRVLDAVESQE